MNNELLALIIGIFIGALVGGLGGCSVESQRWKYDAIRNGVGEYYLDALYAKQFRWKTNEVTK